MQHISPAEVGIKCKHQTNTLAPLGSTGTDRATLVRNLSGDSTDFSNLSAAASSGDGAGSDAIIACFASSSTSSIRLDTDKDYAVASSAEINSIPQLQHWPTQALAGYLISAQSKATPLGSTVFHGRDEELERLVTYSMAPSTAPLGIVGPGGIGKTMLALKLLHEPRVQHHFGRQRFFLNCEGATTRDEILAHLAVELRVQRCKSASLLQAVIDDLRSRQRILLVLDDFESIRSPISEASIAFLNQLAVLDEVTLVITTHENNLPESLTWANAITAELEALSPTTARRTFADLSSLEPRLLESEPEASALTELLRKIDYMPLAVTLLAKLNELPSVLLREWSEYDGDMLWVERHDGICSKLSVEVSIKISLAHLPAESAGVRTRQLLSVLGQLPAGLFPEVSTKLHSTIPNLDVAAQTLLNHSLVYTAENGELRMVKLVRRYISACLPMSSETLSAVDNIYLGIARTNPITTCSGIDKPADEREFANIFSILNSALSRRNDGQLVVAIIRFALFHHHYSCLRLLEELLKHLDHRLSEKAECLRAIADQYQGVGDPQMGIPFLEQAADLFAELKGKASEAASRERLTLISTTLGRQKNADHSAARAQLLPRETSNISRQAVLVGTEGVMLVEQRLRDAREAHRQAGDGPTVSVLSDQILQSIIDRGDMVAYTKELELAIYLGVQTRPGSVLLAATQLQLAQQYLSYDNIVGAEGFLVEAYAVLSEHNDRTGLATATLLLATLREAQFRFSEGAALAESACRLFQECGNPAKAAWCDQEADRMWICAATNE